MAAIKFSCLLGETLKAITVNKDPEVPHKITFETIRGKKFKLHHIRDCCESVEIVDIVGSLDNLIGSQITMAEEVCGVPNPEDLPCRGEHGETGTWTFYKLATVRGYVTIRWLGTSNGYYSESVDFEEIKEE